MGTLRKPICTLVVALTVAFGYLGVWPGIVQAAVPNVDGHWATSRGEAYLYQGDAQVASGPSGRRDGRPVNIGRSGTGMKGWFNLDGFLPIRWGWWRP